MTKLDYEDFVDFVRRYPLGKVPLREALPRGGIIGRVDFVDTVSTSRSPWFNGPVGWKFRNSQALPFLPWKGQLTLFRVDAEEE